MVSMSQNPSQSPSISLDLTSPTASRETIGVVGAGYVGVVTAVALAALGNQVMCLDVSESRINRLRSGSVPFVEPDVDDLLNENFHRMEFTTTPGDLYAHVEIVFICVDTPPSDTGDADLSRVNSVIDAIPLDWTGTLAMKSTVPAGTGTRVEARLRQRGLTGVTYVSNPEFLREGSAIADVFHPDRVVVGSNNTAAADRILALWLPLGGEQLRCDLASAELIKLASNAFLATKISFINEIANVCDNVGADVAIVARGMGLDRRIGTAFLQAGIGYGGSCFPKDVIALKQLAGNSGYHFQLLSSVIEVNNLQRRRLIGTLKNHLGPLRGRRIAILGLAFKPGTDDVRESPGLTLATRLLSEGAVVVAHDPVANDAARPLLAPEVILAETMSDAVAGCDAALIVTDWPEYRALLDPNIRDLMHNPLLLDGRNLLDPTVAAEVGYEWVGIGRPTHLPVRETAVSTPNQATCGDELSNDLGPRAAFSAGS
jgi:UDPglucose 6-dehydrogenase